MMSLWHPYGITVSVMSYWHHAHEGNYLFVIITFTGHENRVLDVYISSCSRCVWFLVTWWPSWIHVNISVIPKTISLYFDTELTKDPYNWKISQKFLLKFFLGKASIFSSLTLLIYEKCFLFHLKSSFCFRDIQFFCISVLPSFCTCWPLL